jgi:hypothetical protein
VKVRSNPAGFACQMEEVLDIYGLPRDPLRPLVSLDEATKQLVKEVTAPMPARPGRPERTDYEYERNGVGTLFMMCAPLEGWREVDVRGRKTAVDYAECLRALSDVHFPHAEKIVLVQGNLNTHGPASFYEAFGPQEAHRLKQRFEFHHTPKHASWRNIAECELSALVRQCLGRRIADMATLTAEVRAWVAARNASHTTVDWQFTTADARIELKKLYPSFHAG